MHIVLPGGWPAFLAPPPHGDYDGAGQLPDTNPSQIQRKSTIVLNGNYGGAAHLLEQFLKIS